MAEPRTVHRGRGSQRRRPTVEKTDGDFTMLGVMVRNCIDFGVREQDHRGVLGMKGEAWSVERLVKQEFLTGFTRQEKPANVHVAELAVEVLGGLVRLGRGENLMVPPTQHLGFPDADKLCADAPAAIGSQDKKHVHERNGIPEVVETKPTDRRTVTPSDKHPARRHLLLQSPGVSVVLGKKRQIIVTGILNDKPAAHT